MSDQVDFILSQWNRERPELSAEPIGVIGRISRAARHIDTILDKNFKRFGLNGGDFDVLVTLRRSGSPYELTPTALYKAMMLSSGAMTNRLDRLEGRGLIERAPDPRDRRGTLVRLSSEALSIIDATMSAHVEYEARMLETFTKEEQHGLADLLRKLLISFGENGPR